MNEQTPTFAPDMLFESLFNFGSLFGLSHTVGTNFNSVYATFLAWWQVFSIFSLLLSALFLFGIIYAKLRYSELAHIFHERLLKEEEMFRQSMSATVENRRWLDVEMHGESDNPNDWRLAIIEADIILDEILEERGYHGMTIAEKLKQANPQSFRSIEDAWQAHKVRNDIAHRGGDFILTKKMAADTILRYKRVFTEFEAI